MRCRYAGTLTERMHDLPSWRATGRPGRGLLCPVLDLDAVAVNPDPALK